MHELGHGLAEYKTRVSLFLRDQANVSVVQNGDREHPSTFVPAIGPDPASNKAQDGGPIYLIGSTFITCTDVLIASS